MTPEEQQQSDFPSTEEMSNAEIIKEYLMYGSNKEKASYAVFMLSLILVGWVAIQALSYWYEHRETETLPDPLTQLAIEMDNHPYTAGFAAVYSDPIFTGCKRLISESGFENELVYQIMYSRPILKETFAVLEAENVGLPITPDLIEPIAMSYWANVFESVPSTEACKGDLALAKLMAGNFLQAYYFTNELYITREVWTPPTQEKMQSLPEALLIEGAPNPTVLNPTQHYLLLPLSVSTIDDVLNFTTLQSCSAYPLSIDEILRFNGLVPTDLANTDLVGSSNQGRDLRDTFRLVVPLAIGENINSPRIIGNCRLFQVLQPRNRNGSITRNDLQQQLRNAGYTATLHEVMDQNGLVADINGNLSRARILPPTNFVGMTPRECVNTLRTIEEGGLLQPGQLIIVPV
jgi:hypothetical protein